MRHWRRGGKDPADAGRCRREERRISYSAEVKSELAALLPARPCCQLSELRGIFSASRGRLIGDRGRTAAYFSLLRNTVARKVVRLGRAIGHLEAKYHALRSAKRMAFFIELPLPPGLEGAFAQPAARAVPEAACDRKAMLRGLFLGCGSVNTPSARYHMEFVLPTLGWATAMLRLLTEVGVHAGGTERAGQQVIYVKDGDGIVRLLSLMGASRAVIQFENVRVVRDVSNSVNRKLNLETANIDKTIGSGLRQVAAIESLEGKELFRKLSPALQEMARYRKANPQLNLSELALRMGLSKSAVNHRLRRLLELAGPAARGQRRPTGLEGLTSRSA